MSIRPGIKSIIVLLANNVSMKRDLKNIVIETNKPRPALSDIVTVHVSPPYLISVQFEVPAWCNLSFMRHFRSTEYRATCKVKFNGRMILFIPCVKFFFFRYYFCNILSFLCEAQQKAFDSFGLLSPDHIVDVVCS